MHDDTGIFQARPPAPFALDGEAMASLKGPAEATRDRGEGVVASWAYHGTGDVRVPSAWLLELLRLAERPPAARVAGGGIYVASRASIPARAEMWRALRADGWPIVSSWIDEDGEGATDDFGELWGRITREVVGAAGLILHAEPGDFPLKGAYIEVGMALAAGIPVYAHLPGVALEPRSMRPAGSWLKVVSHFGTAFRRPR